MNKKIQSADPSTKTLNRDQMQEPTQNIYKAISIIGKRAEQINVDIKKELEGKLEEFAMPHNENLEEVFENKEQVAVSKYYESLPKPHSVAVREWMDGDIYYRDVSESEEETPTTPTTSENKEA